jgi:hypothetical protein
MPSDFFAQGQCLCGAVRFISKAKPVRMAQCHCRDCQRVSGAGHTSNALFEAANVEVTGRTSSFALKADSGNTLTRHFCPICGSRVFATNSGRPGMIVLPAGSFDDSSWFSPQAVLYTRSRHDWDTAGDTVPAFAAMSPPPSPLR